MSTLIVNSNGIELIARRTGSGAPVVFVHGSGGDLDSWNQVIAHLTDDHECWTYTRRGYALRGGVGTPHTFHDDVQDLVDVIRVAGSRVHVVAGSYGATVALHTALAAPESMRTLAIFEPPLFAAGPALLPVLERYRELLTQHQLSRASHLFAAQVARMPLDLLGPEPDAVSSPAPEPDLVAQATGFLHDLEALADDTPELDRWSQLTVPVLLLEGELTWEPMPSTMSALARRLPAGTERIVLRGQTHFATHADPAQFAGALRRSALWR